jgi:hypothetical protein
VIKSGLLLGRTMSVSRLAEKLLKVGGSALHAKERRLTSAVCFIVLTHGRQAIIGYMTVEDLTITI